MSAYKSFTLNDPGQSPVWSIQERDTFKDVIDTLVIDCCSATKQASTGHKHFKFYDSTGATAFLQSGTADVVFNDAGSAIDFRFEGDTLQNLLLLDGSADRVAVGHNTPDRLFHVELSTSGTASMDYPFRISKTCTGSAGNDFGAGLELELEDNAGTNRIAGKLETYWVSAADGDSAIRLKSMLAQEEKTICNIYGSGTDPYRSYFYFDSTAYSEIGLGLGGGYLQTAADKLNISSGATTGTIATDNKLIITSTIATATADRKFQVEDSTATTDSVQYLCRLLQKCSGTPLPNFGVGQEFVLDDASNTERVAGKIETYWNDASAKDSRMRFTGMTGAAAANVAEIFTYSTLNFLVFDSGKYSRITFGKSSSTITDGASSVLTIYPGATGGTVDINSNLEVEQSIYLANTTGSIRNDGTDIEMVSPQYFKFLDDILLNSTEKLLFNDANTYMYGNYPHLYLASDAGCGGSTIYLKPNASGYVDVEAGTLRFSFNHATGSTTAIGTLGPFKTDNNTSVYLLCQTSAAS
jgi:hypothetical protein